MSVRYARYRSTGATGASSSPRTVHDSRRAGCGGVDRGVDRFDVTADLIPVLAGSEPKRVADQMDNAGLHDGLRPDVADDFGQPLQSITDDEEDVLDASIA